MEFLFSKLYEYGTNWSGLIDFNSNVQSLETNWKALSAKASDVEEQINNEERPGKKKRKREVENWMEEVQNVKPEFLELENKIKEGGFIGRLFEGDQVINLKARVDELLGQSQHLGDLLLDVSGNRGAPLLVTELVGGEFEKNVEIIQQFLADDEVRVIGIYGMGGVGKTTLAKHINNFLVEKTRDLIHWTTVSQIFTIHNLQDEIGKVLGLNLSDENNADKRAATLNRALSRKKNFVLIFDDVWKTIDLQMLGDPLSVDGCRLIITTRSKEVCCQMGCRKIIKVRKLPEDEAWNLFDKTLGQEMGLTPQVKEIAKLVAKECDGLPLALITMAGSMRGVIDICLWRNALTELKECMGENDMEEKVFRVLKYSFDRLDPNYERERNGNEYTNIQLCFLYCSLYPEDFAIRKTELVRIFVREKLTSRRNSRRDEYDQGFSILDKLVNVCLLEIAYEGQCVKMHDLVRDMALNITRNNPKFISRSKLFLHDIPSEEEWTEDLNKMSLFYNRIAEIAPGTSPDCRNLSTLLLDNNPLEFIPDSFFVKMCGLSVLNLSYTQIKELPDSLS